MTKPNSHASVRIVLQGGEPYLESRVRPYGDAEGGPVPKGKILVMRTPLLSSSEDDVESELVDDDGSDEAFCPECAAAGHDPGDGSQRPALTRRDRAVPDHHARGAIRAGARVR